MRRRSFRKRFVYGNSPCWRVRKVSAVRLAVLRLTACYTHETTMRGTACRGGVVVVRGVSPCLRYPDARRTVLAPVVHSCTVNYWRMDERPLKPPVAYYLLPRAHQEEAASEGSDSESSSAEGLKRGKSWIKSLGRRRRSSGTSGSRGRGKRGASRDREGSSDDSGDGPLTSGSSEGEGGGEEEDGDGGLLLGKRAR